MEVASTAIARDLLFPDGVRWFWLLRLAWLWHADGCVGVGRGRGGRGPLGRARQRANDCVMSMICEIKPCIGRERETGAAVALETQALFSDSARVALKPLLSSFWSWGVNSVIADAVDKIPFRRT